MNTPFRLRFTTARTSALVGLLLSQCLPVAVYADSASGVDTALGNGMNTGVAKAKPARDPDASELKRSPVGRLYDWSYLVPEERRKTKSGWEYDFEVEAGLLGASGDDEHVLFQRYKDLDDGLYLRRFDFTADRASDGAFVSLLGGGAGYDDQYYALTVGKHNSWQARAFFNESPAVFTTNFRSLWKGEGTGLLTLNGLTPGGLATANATQAALRNALATTPQSTVALTRSKAGLRVDMTLNPAWKAYASYSSEDRKGSRPYGMVFGGGGGGGDIEFNESIDYNTVDLLAGVQHVDPLNSFNFQLSASMFRNDIDTMTIENPLTATVNTLAGVPATAFKSARFDLYPDNDFLKAKGEYARQLPGFWNGRFTAVAAFTRSEQDDALIAPTTLALTGGTINGVSAANVWNTTAGLSRDSAEAQIDSTLLTLGLALRPSTDLSLKADARYYRTENSMEYWACNPLTGQWGRLINDGSGGAFVNTPAYLASRCNLDAVRALNVVPSAGNVTIGSVPFEYEQRTWTLSADYRAWRDSNISLQLEREEFDRAHRERSKTWEHRARLGYTNRGFERATLLLSYEYADRGGSGYVVDPYEEFKSGSLGPLPSAAGTNMASWFHNIDSLRKLDLADRRQHTANARVNLMVTDALDVGLSGQYRDVKYPESQYGRKANDQVSVSLEANYQPSSRLALWGYYTWQDGSMAQRGLQANACVLGSTYYFFSNGAVATTAAPPAGTTLVGSTLVTTANVLSVCGQASALSPLYPTSRSWDNRQRDENHTASVGLRYELEHGKFELSYTYLGGRQKTSYAYNAAALGLTPLQVGLIGDGMPDQVIEINTLDASLEFPFSASTSARLLMRIERGRIRDWHYDGVAVNPVPANNAVYLDSGPQYSYDASLIGFFVRTRF